MPWLTCSQPHCDPSLPPSLPHQPQFPYSLLAGVHITSPDLLPVLAAGQLGSLKPLLHCHEPLLNTSTTQLGTFCPTWPRSHFTPWEMEIKKKLRERVDSQNNVWSCGSECDEGDDANLDARKWPQVCPVCSSSFLAAPCVVSSHRCWLVLDCTSWSYTSSSGWFQSRGLLQIEAPASPCESGSYDPSHRTYCTLTTQSTLTWHSLWLREQNWIHKKTVGKFKLVKINIFWKQNKHF